METNIVVDISPQISYLAKFWFSSYGSKFCQPIKLQDFLKCNISKKKWMMKFIFGLQINIEVFYRLYYHFGFVQLGMPKVPKMRSLDIFAITPEKRCEVVFCMQMNAKVFYKLIVSLWVFLASHSQSTQNNKFTISL